MSGSSFAFCFTGIADGDFRPEAEGHADAVGALLRTLAGERCVMVRQVHGARVVDAAGVSDTTEADAILCTDPRVVVAVRVADCVPVLIGGPGGVVAVHAGWRGTVAGIVRNAVEALCDRIAAPPSALRAWVGPCVGGSVYRVGPEVVAGIDRIAVNRRWLGADNHVDLALVNADVMESLGVGVTRESGCTVTDPRYWSHRRDGDRAGRQVGAIRWCG